MSGSGVMVAGSLAGLAAAGVTTAAASTVVRRERTYLPRGHAARVDQRRDPLSVALRYGCAGLTVGVHVDARRRLILAGGHNSGRSLRSHVLDPLAARIGAAGRVYGSQHEPFTIVLEAADGVEPARVLDVLADNLDGCADILTRCVAGGVRPGPVLVVLAGAPRTPLDRRSDRLYFGEGTLSDVGGTAPTASLPVVGEHVAWRIGWDGRGEITAEERHLLRAMIQTAHVEGRRVRFYGVPEARRAVRQAFWSELRAAGADLISARDLPALRRILRGQHTQR